VRSAYILPAALFSLSRCQPASASAAFSVFSATVELGSRAFSTGKPPIVPIPLPRIRPQGRIPFAMQQTTLKVACLQLACGADKQQNIDNAAGRIREAAQACALHPTTPSRIHIRVHCLSTLLGQEFTCLSHSLALSLSLSWARALSVSPSVHTLAISLSLSPALFPSLSPSLSFSLFSPDGS